MADQTETPIAELVVEPMTFISASGRTYPGGWLVRTPDGSTPLYVTLDEGRAHAFADNYSELGYPDLADLPSKSGGKR